jgi:hypothetical protein
MANVEGTGHMAIIITQPMPGERHTFAVALLDLWERGVEDVWGNAKAEPKALAATLGHFASLQPQVSWRPMPARQAIALIQQAHRVSQMHTQLIPSEFWVWYDLYATPVEPPPVIRRLRRL